MSEKQEKQEKQAARKEVSLTRAQLQTARAFSDRQDLVAAVMSEDETLTSAELHRRMDAFLKGKVD